MPNKISAAPSQASPQTPQQLVAEALEYLVDAGQRSVLFWDVMRKRGEQYREHMGEVAPHVLDYSVELVIDGRTLERPVNYALVRIEPPAGVIVDDRRRPFVVVDPRAGHGPGIGGFKADSEIGVALQAGHPCYFIGFLPEPVPGQTIEDIAWAEGKFLEKVLSLHPDADGKPCVVGNCQAGWAVMILASLRPELFGPLVIAGSPLSYWTGVRGQHPMRYTGGLLGGTWLTALTSDLGGGKFDGAWLVQNFENLNPSNTLWSKQYNLYSKIDAEAPRYLEFERWWGGHVKLNAEEMQFIADELFVGNKLAAGQIRAGDGTVVDLRNIRSPIVIFCSKGDNITPPPQALGWILDLYESVDEIRAYGQTIVYTVHETVGHLGIFVSGGVARKEHSEFSSNIDLIDVLPPGLYEATFAPKSDTSVNVDLVSGEWMMRCEPRTLEDIRAFGGNSLEDEMKFATAARVSEINLAAYRTFVQPWIKALAPKTGGRLDSLHPLRLPYEVFSKAGPLMKQVERTADNVRQQRKPAADDNSFVKMQDQLSEAMVAGLQAWTEARDNLSEAIFLAMYGSPALQALTGVSEETIKARKPGKSPVHAELLRMRIAEIKSRAATGGLRECVVRGLLYAGMKRGGVDERALAALRRLRMKDEGPRLTLAEFKSMAREQFFLLLIDQEAALSSIPKMLPASTEQRRDGLAAIMEVLNASGEIAGEVAERLTEVTRLFETKPAQGDTALAKAS
jgi:hypothetical protein